MFNEFYLTELITLLLSMVFTHSGLEHVRVLDLMPRPQVVEQRLQLDHRDQAPSIPLRRRGSRFLSFHIGSSGFATTHAEL